MVLCFNLIGCGKQDLSRMITEQEKKNAVWLNMESAEDFYSAAKKVGSGKVVISDTLDKGMKAYSEDTVFAVAVCFSSMVSERKLEQYSYSEKSEYLAEMFAKAKEPVEKTGILVHYPVGTCENYQFFYAFGTASQFRSIRGKLGTSLYIAATYQYK
jgi:hypothetical protein